MTSIAEILGNEKEVTNLVTQKLTGQLKLPPGIGSVVPLQTVLGSVWELLDTLKVEEILALAWEKSKAVENAKKATLGQPGASQLIKMAGRKLTSVHKPRLECSVSSASYPILNLELTLILTLEAVNLVIKEGRLDHVGPGPATAEVTLDVVDLPVVKKVNLFDKKKVMHLNLAPSIQPPLPKSLQD